MKILLIGLAVLVGLAVGYSLPDTKAKEEIYRLESDLGKAKYEIIQLESENTATRKLFLSSVSAEEHQEVIDKYNTLVDQYNSLAGSRNYNRINCTSTYSGTTTYTNCY